MRTATCEEIKLAKKEIKSRYREIWFATWIESNASFLLDFFDNKKSGIPELTGKKNLRIAFERHCDIMAGDMLVSELMHMDLSLY